MNRAELDELVEDVANRRAEFNAQINRGSYVWLLRVLEMPYEEAKKELPLAFEKAGLTDFYGAVSLQRLAGFALNLEGAGHWAELAAEWLEGGLHVDNELLHEIDRMIANRRGTQQARQKALRSVRRVQAVDKHRRL